MATSWRSSTEETPSCSPTQCSRLLNYWRGEFDSTTIPTSLWQVGVFLNLFTPSSSPCYITLNRTPLPCWVIHSWTHLCYVTLEWPPFMIYYLYNKGETSNYQSCGFSLTAFGSTWRLVDLFRWTQRTTTSCKISLFSKGVPWGGFLNCCYSKHVVELWPRTSEAPGSWPENTLSQYRGF